MRLEHLCDMELQYQGGFTLVKPYGGEEGAGYGGGDGKATGKKLAGTVRWVNHPRRRSDGRMLPNAAGVVETDDGAMVIFSSQGRTVFRQTESGESKGGQLLWMTFESEAERYLWLNDSLCVVEGIIDPVTLHVRFRVYSCINELIK